MFPTRELVISSHAIRYCLCFMGIFSQSACDVQLDFEEDTDIVVQPVLKAGDCVSIRIENQSKQRTVGRYRSRFKYTNPPLLVITYMGLL